MLKFEKFLFVLLLTCMLYLLGCESNEVDTSKGYIVSSLIEVNGKQRINRTSEISPCRIEEVWIFDFSEKMVMHAFDKVDCPAAPWKVNVWEPFDTGYVSSLKGRFLSLRHANQPGSSVFTLPPLHKEFTMLSSKTVPGEEGVDYPLIKFDRQEVIIRNQFDHLKVPRDSQYFELTMKYVEQ